MFEFSNFWGYSYMFSFGYYCVDDYLGWMQIFNLPSYESILVGCWMIILIYSFFDRHILNISIFKFFFLIVNLLFFLGIKDHFIGRKKYFMNIQNMLISKPEEQKRGECL